MANTVARIAGIARMHPKPGKRHGQAVEDVQMSFSFAHMQEETPVHVVFSFDDGKRQRLVMNKAQARMVADTLLRFAAMD